MALLIHQQRIRVPVLHIKDDLYLLGSKRGTCQMINDIVLVRVGGGQDRFEEFMTYNHRSFERALVIYMFNSGQSLQWVVEQLMLKNQIRGGLHTNSIKNHSPVRASSPSKLT